METLQRTHALIRSIRRAHLARTAVATTGLGALAGLGLAGVGTTLLGMAARWLPEVRGVLPNVRVVSSADWWGSFVGALGDAAPLWAGSAALGAAVGAAIAWRTKMDRRAAAARIDRSIGTHDRVATAVELEGATDLFSRVACGEAEETVAGLSATRVLGPIPRRSWTAWPFVPAGVAVVAIVAALAPTWSKPAKRLEAPLAATTQEVLEAEKLLKEAREAGPISPRVQRAMDEAEAELKGRGPDASVLTKSAAVVQQATDELQRRAAEQRAEADREAEALARGVQDASPASEVMKDASRSIRNGDLDQAAESLEAAQKRVPNLSEEERRALADDLRALAEAMEPGTKDESKGAKPEGSADDRNGANDPAEAGVKPQGDEKSADGTSPQANPNRDPKTEQEARGAEGRAASDAAKADQEKRSFAEELRRAAEEVERQPPSSGEQATPADAKSGKNDAEKSRGKENKNPNQAAESVRPDNKSEKADGQSGEQSKPNESTPTPGERNPSASQDGKSVSPDSKANTGDQAKSPAAGEKPKTGSEPTDSANSKKAEPDQKKDGQNGPQEQKPASAEKPNAEPRESPSDQQSQESPPTKPQDSQKSGGKPEGEAPQGQTAPGSNPTGTGQEATPQPGKEQQSGSESGKQQNTSPDAKGGKSQSSQQQGKGNDQQPQGLERLAERVREMQGARERAADAEKQAQRMREKADDLSDQRGQDAPGGGRSNKGTPSEIAKGDGRSNAQEKRPGSNSGSTDAQPGGRGGSDRNAGRAGSENPSNPQQARQGPLDDRPTTLVDARPKTARDPAAKGEDRTIAEWVQPDGKVERQPGASDTASGLSREVRQVAEGTERAIEQQSVPTDRADLVRRVFRRFLEKTEKPTDSGGGK